MKELQSSLIGAGILAATGTGKFASTEEGAGRMAQVNSIFRPKAENIRKYEYIYAKYCITSRKCITL